VNYRGLFIAEKRQLRQRWEYVGIPIAAEVLERILKRFLAQVEHVAFAPNYVRRT